MYLQTVVQQATWIRKKSQILCQNIKKYKVPPDYGNGKAK